MQAIRVMSKNAKPIIHTYLLLMRSKPYTIADRKLARVLKIIHPHSVPPFIFLI